MIQKSESGKFVVYYESLEEQDLLYRLTRLVNFTLDTRNKKAVFVFDYPTLDSTVKKIIKSKKKEIERLVKDLEEKEEIWKSFITNLSFKGDEC